MQSSGPAYLLTSIGLGAISQRTELCSTAAESPPRQAVCQSKPLENARAFQIARESFYRGSHRWLGLRTGSSLSYQRHNQCQGPEVLAQMPNVLGGRASWFPRIKLVCASFRTLIEGEVHCVEENWINECENYLMFWMLDGCEERKYSSSIAWGCAIQQWSLSCFGSGSNGDKIQDRRSRHDGHQKPGWTGAGFRK